MQKRRNQLAEHLFLSESNENHRCQTLAFLIGTVDVAAQLNVVADFPHVPAKEAEACQKNDTKNNRSYHSYSLVGNRIQQFTQFFLVLTTQRYSFCFGSQNGEMNVTLRMQLQIFD